MRSNAGRVIRLGNVAASRLARISGSCGGRYGCGSRGGVESPLRGVRGPVNCIMSVSWSIAVIVVKLVQARTMSVHNERLPVDSQDTIPQTGHPRHRLTGQSAVNFTPLLAFRH